MNKPFLPSRLALAVSCSIIGGSLALCGCNSQRGEDKPLTTVAPVVPDQDRSAGAFADTDPWILKTTDPNAARGNHGIFLGNGYLGATFGPNGGASKDSLVFVAGEYDKAETLQKFPSWHDLGLTEAKPGGKYEQTLDMKTGILTTKMDGVTVTSFIAGEGTQARALLVENVEGAPQPTPLPETVTQTLISANLTIKPGVTGNSWTRYATPQELTRNVMPVVPDSFAEARQQHEKIWADRWKADITIEGDPEAQQLVHKLMFDLLQSERPDADTSIAPESLSGDFYKGHIFWDAEVWMLPALLPQHPELAKSMLEYRFKHLPQAQALAKKQGCSGADFPWESAASGNETAPGGFSQGRHVTAGIGWAAYQYYLATGDRKWLAERGWPLLSNIADYFATRARKNAAGKFDILKVFGPDENKGECDNNTYTNAMAKNVLNYATETARIVGKPANPRWKTVADSLSLPFDAANHRYLARDGDKGEKTKQADGELLLWPADLPMDAKTAEATFDFHKTRPIATGPAMTDSIHALIAARLGRADEAEKYFRASYRPFVRGPFLLFSEKRTLDRCVFTTGAGGVLQSVLYGFGGLDFSRPKGVIDGPVALPPSWKKLTITGIRRAGKRYTLTVTPQARTLTPEK